MFSYKWTSGKMEFPMINYMEVDFYAGSRTRVQTSNLNAFYTLIL